MVDYYTCLSSSFYPSTNAQVGWVELNSAKEITTTLSFGIVKVKAQVDFFKVSSVQASLSATYNMGTIIVSICSYVLSVH